MDFRDHPDLVERILQPWHRLYLTVADQMKQVCRNLTDCENGLLKNASYLLDSRFIDAHDSVGHMAGKVECREQLGGVLRYCHSAVLTNQCMTSQESLSAMVAARVPEVVSPKSLENLIVRHGYPELTNSSRTCLNGVIAQRDINPHGDLRKL